MELVEGAFPVHIAKEVVFEAVHSNGKFTVGEEDAFRFSIPKPAMLSPLLLFALAAGNLLSRTS